MRASGSSSCSFSRRCLDRLDLVVQEVDLAAALQLAQHRLADRAAGLAAHEGLDRQAALRRGGDHAQVAQAFERHAQRARDRRGGEREHVDLGAHRLHRLLVAHAEAVLLVDDEQAQALELDRLADSSLCVPTTMSIVPSARPSIAALTSLAERKRDISATFTGHLPKRSAMFW